MTEEDFIEQYDKTLDALGSASVEIDVSPIHKTLLSMRKAILACLELEPPVVVGNPYRAEGVSFDFSLLRWNLKVVEETLAEFPLTPDFWGELYGHALHEREKLQRARLLADDCYDQLEDVPLDDLVRK